ncbi:hypothetical protein ACFLQV_02625 [Calditrichota bacterium]
MKRNIFLLLCLITAGLISCKFEKRIHLPTPPPQEEPEPELSYISLSSTDYFIRGNVGDELSAILTAIARDQNHIRMEGVIIDFAILHPKTFKGTLILGDDSLSNQHGVVEVEYAVTLSELNASPDNFIEIQAKSGDIMTRLTIDVATMYGDSTFWIECPTRLFAPAGTRRNLPLTICLMDSNFLPMENVRIYLNEDPATIAYLDSHDGLTNADGKLYRTLTNYKDKSGEVTVTARMREREASVTIKVETE